MKHLFSIGSGLIILAITAEAYASPLKVYVSPTGNDAWTGNLASPNATATDGPFATIEHAQQVVRQVMKGAPTKIDIVLRAGTYHLDAPLAFAADDSGHPGAPVIYEAYPNERPIVTGGIDVDGFSSASDHSWQKQLDQSTADSIIWGPASLYFDGRRHYRPRLPKSGYFTVAETEEPTPANKGLGYDRLGYKAGDIDPRWLDEPDVEVLPFHVWTMSRFRLASIDDAAHILTWAGRTPRPAAWMQSDKGKRYLIENVKEAFGDPGSYYYDPSNRTLRYMPTSGESPPLLGAGGQTPSTIHVTLPHLTQLVTFDHAHDITLRGIRFECTGWSTPPDGHSSMQADIDVPGAIAMTSTSHCAIDDCIVAHTGGWAVDIGENCSDIDIKGCYLDDLGAGGVKIGGEQTTHNVTVEHTQIAHGGRIHPAATGVWIGHSSYNRIAHNTIEDFYYTGISAGWTWGYAPSQANHNLITYNWIDNIGQGVLSDMGGIYTLGVSPGTVIDHNWVGNVVTYDYGGFGIYLDEGSSNINVTNNIVYQVKSGCFHQHYGEANAIANNIWAFGEKAQVVRTRPENHLSLTFTHNIVLYRHGFIFGGDWTGKQYKLVDNLYWNVDGMSKIDRRALDEREAAGTDSGSLIADPRFVDSDHGDFRLDPASPAARIKFVPIDTNGIGKGDADAVHTQPPAFPIGYQSAK